MHTHTHTHTHCRKCYQKIQPRRPATPSRQVSASPLQWLSYCAILVWSVWRATMCKTWMKPTAMHSSCLICDRQTAMTSIQLTTSRAQVSNEATRQKCRCEGFEAESDWCVAGVGQSIINNAIAWSVAQMYLCLHSNQAVFLLDPTIRGKTGKPGEVIRGSGDGSPQRGPATEPLVGGGGYGVKPPKRGSGVEPPELNRF